MLSLPAFDELGVDEHRRNRTPGLDEVFSEFSERNAQLMSLSACVLSMWCDIAVSGSYMVFWLYTAIGSPRPKPDSPLAHHICGQFSADRLVIKCRSGMGARLNLTMDAPVEHPLSKDFSSSFFISYVKSPKVGWKTERQLLSSSSK